MNSISPIKARILKYIECQLISKYEFYKRSGITRGVLDQPNGISEGNIAKFVAFAPDVRLDWLLKGEGEMLKSHDPADSLKPTHINLTLNLQIKKVK